uniref:Protein kinase domain-containing protein n=1 Tax=Ananas comosus var. bracteatus TaxID=296719 RepID=A0A6V7Q548_ANACO|nr:unnamed protein product [Ananas comosus var. bracteatus]
MAMTFFSCCFFFLLLFAAAAAAAAPLPALALLSLKSSLVDPLSSLRDWTYASAASAGGGGGGGDDPRPWCSWSGVTCHPATRDVTGLDLSRRNLSGSLPPELLLLSPALARLNLSSNSFRGPLPSLLLRLPSLLSLDVSHNDFNSTFPSPSPSPSPTPRSSLATLNAYSNSFTGPLPRALLLAQFSPSLEYLNLGGSFFDGSIPPEIGSLSKLRFLHLAGNLLTGQLPPQLGSLLSLDHLELGYNSYAGGIPAELGKLRNLRYLDISSASLSGPLPPALGGLPRLESLLLFKNRLAGPIPARLSRLQALRVLDLSDNRLSGPIPAALAGLANLTLLSLMSNALSGPIPGPLGDLPNLEALNLWNNSLTGPLPQRLGSNRRLARLDASTNLLSGPIPPRLCAGNRLVRLILFSNRLGSEIPRASRPAPRSGGNSLSGAIPRDLCGAASLAYFNVSGNPLRRALPRAIWTAPRLQVFAAGYCGLTGEVPSFASGCSDFYRIDLEGNDLRGTIPSDVVRCDKLVSLKLDRNRLTGEIPREVAMLPSITEVDLSWNNLSGPIPPEFDNCSTLESLDVSFNRLTGPVPSTISSVMQFEGNVGLCGEAVDKPCGGGRGDGDPFLARRTAGGVIMLAGATAVAVAGLVVLAVGMRWSREGGEADAKGGAVGPGQWQMMAFQRLNFTAEDVAAACADRGSARVVGAGSTGTVYRAEMPNGEVIAVKELRLPHNKGKRGKEKSNGSSKREAITVAAAAAEVEVLGSVRHRNIVRLLGWCRNNETVLLLYEYMPNGSLEKLLHGGGNIDDDKESDKRAEKRGGGGGVMAVDWETRYKIAVGVAQGMSYLHHDCTPLVVHRDLKPSNILLDAEMEARVADFGLAKFMDGAVAPSVSEISGSYSYIAPEYACTLKVDERSDIYSYGVVLMEIVSGRRSVEPEYGEGNSIVEWIRQKLVSGTDDRAIWDVLDATIANCKEVRKEMMLVLRVAILCTCKSPSNGRPCATC